MKGGAKKPRLQTAFLKGVPSVGVARVEEGGEGKSGHVRLVAYGHVTCGGAQAAGLGVLPRKSQVKWGTRRR